VEKLQILITKDDGSKVFYDLEGEITEDFDNKKVPTKGRILITGEFTEAKNIEPVKPYRNPGY